MESSLCESGSEAPSSLSQGIFNFRVLINVIIPVDEGKARPLGVRVRENL